MADDYLYSQLFNKSSPVKSDKKEANDDVLNSLFAIQLPNNNKPNSELKRKKTEEEANSYIDRVNKFNIKANNQSKLVAQRLKEERTLPAHVVR